MLNSFVQSVSLDVVDHLVGAVRFEIGKSSETPATSEGKSTLPQTTTLPTSLSITIRGFYSSSMGTSRRLGGYLSASQSDTPTSTEKLIHQRSTPLSI